MRLHRAKIRAYCCWCNREVYHAPRRVSRLLQITASVVTLGLVHVVWPYRCTACGNRRPFSDLAAALLDKLVLNGSMPATITGEAWRMMLTLIGSEKLKTLLFPGKKREEEASVGFKPTIADLEFSSDPRQRVFNPPLTPESTGKQKRFQDRAAGTYVVELGPDELIKVIQNTDFLSRTAKAVIVAAVVAETTNIDQDTARPDKPR